MLGFEVYDNMRITIDNIEESIKKITLEVDFKNGTSHKEVYYESEPTKAEKVLKEPKESKELKKKDKAQETKEVQEVKDNTDLEVTQIPEAPDISNREEKEIPEEMLNFEF